LQGKDVIKHAIDLEPAIPHAKLVSPSTISPGQGDDYEELKNRVRLIRARNI
jgi:hypothetical protein